MGEEHTLPRPTGWLGKSDITSKFYEFKRILDAVRGGWISLIGSSVAAGLVEIGSGLVGFVVFEGAFSLHRRTHTHLSAITLGS